jgi:hypothetical protein
MYYIMFWSQYSKDGPVMETLGSDCWLPVDGRRTKDYWAHEAKARADYLNSGSRHHKIVGYEVRVGERGSLFSAYWVIVPLTMLT